MLPQEGTAVAKGASVPRPQVHGSEPRVILPSRGHLTMSGDILNCHIWEAATGI